jgi:hypothetical protein
MPEELKAERDKWDKNKDGFIDLEEFKAYIQARAQQWQAQRAQGGDGQAGGFVIAPSPVEEEAPKPVVYRAGKLPPNLPAWFAQLDTDKDGQIGLYEWKASGRPIEEFERMDLNNDGFLTVHEVMRSLGLDKQVATTASPGAEPSPGAPPAGGQPAWGGQPGGAPGFGPPGGAPGFGPPGGGRPGFGPPGGGGRWGGGGGRPGGGGGRRPGG